MSETSTPIFSDLEIDTTDFLTSRERVEEFSKAVYAAARALEKILDRNSSVSSFEEKAKRDFERSSDYKAKFKEMFDPVLDALYEQSETMDLPLVYGLSEALAALAKDLKNTIHMRARSEYINEVTATTDKKLAQVQHKRLREAFKPYVAMVKLMHGISLQEIKAKPGNFQSEIGTTTAFLFEDMEEPMYNPRAVARKLGIFHDNILFSDVIEWLAENDPAQNLVKIVQVKL